MKNLFSFLLIISSLLCLVSCGPTSDEAVKYNDKLVELQSGIFEKENDLADAMSKNLSNKLKPAYDSLCLEVKKSNEEAKKIEAFDGTTELRDAAIKIFEAYTVVIEKDYPEIIKYYQIPDSLYTQETDDKIISLSEKIDSLLDKPIAAFSARQKEFSEKYKFDLSIKIPEN